MGVTTTHLNERLELFEGVYSAERQSELESLGRIYNPSLGPATAVNLHRPDPFDLSMHSSFGTHSTVGRIMRDLTVKAGIADAIIVPGGGKGASMRQPFLGALGELAERLLAVLHYAGIATDLVNASYAELIAEGRRALGPDELPLFAPEQYARPNFAYTPFEADTPLRWIEGRDLLSGEPVMVPAQLVLIYYKHHPTEAHIGYPTTGGLAFHHDRNRALLHGLYEYIERDAINVRWYCRIETPRVEIDLDAFLRRSLDMRHMRLRTATIPEIALFLNTLDIPIPILTAIAIDHSRRERSFLGGGGAWSTRERALSQALFELGQSRTALKFYRSIGLKDIRPDSTIGEMTDFFDAAIFMGFRENLPRLDWYLGSSQRIAWDDVPTSRSADEETELRTALDRFGALGIRPIAFDMTGACWPGIWVTKVFIPELTQACVPSHPYLGHPRYTELPFRLGLASRPLSFADLNTDPVPFP